MRYILLYIVILLICGVTIRDFWHWVEGEPWIKGLIGIVAILTIIFFMYLWYKTFILNSFKPEITSTESKSLKIDTIRDINPKPSPKMESEEPKKDETPKGDSYSITNYGENKGVIASRIDKLDVTVKSEHEEVLHSSINDGGTWDSTNKILIIQPKTGKWERPFILIHAEEKDRVNPKFSSQSTVMFNIREGNFTLQDGKEYYGWVINFEGSGGIPATKDFYYKLTCSSTPSEILYGNFNSESGYLVKPE